MLTLRLSYRAFSVAAAALLLAMSLPVAAAESEADLLGVLRGDAAPADKAIACKKLAVYGSKAAVPDLAKFLSNPQLASWARIALEAIPGAEADEALRKSTESLEGNLLIGVINSIGVRRDSSAVELLTARLNDKDSEIVTAAAIALGSIGNDAAAKTLLKTLGDAPVALRGGIAEACILCAERQLAENHADVATALYDNVRKADVPRQRKLEATRGAIIARKQDGLPLLVEQLRADDAGMFQIALSTAREVAGAEVDKALVAELEKAAPERAALMISVIADRASAGSLAAVLKAAGSGAKPVRLASLSAISRIGDASCLTTLLDAAIDADAEIAQAAQATISELPGEGINEAILSRLPNAKGKLYLLLIETIGQRRIDAVPSLVSALDNSDKAVRAAALTALGNTVTPKSLNVLIAQVVTPKQADDRPAALQALKTASVRMPDRDACATELAAAMGKANAATKDDLLEIVSEVGGAKALQTIGSAAKSSDAQLQDTGSRLLGKWPSVDAAPVLLDLAKTATSDKYHVRAVKGYISLARRFATMPEPQRLEICQNALDVARYPGDKKLVLDVLKLYPTVESLKLAIKASQIADIKADATQAAKDIVPKVKGEQAQAQAREILAKAGLDK